IVASNSKGMRSLCAASTPVAAGASATGAPAAGSDGKAGTPGHGGRNGAGCEDYQCGARSGSAGEVDGADADTCATRGIGASPPTACTSRNDPYSIEMVTAVGAAMPKAPSASTAAASRVPQPPKLTGSVANTKIGTAHTAIAQNGMSTCSARAAQTIEAIASSCTSVDSTTCVR